MHQSMYEIIWIILLNIVVWIVFVYLFKKGKGFEPRDSIFNWVTFIAVLFYVIAYNPKYVKILAIVGFIVFLIVFSLGIIYTKGRHEGVKIWTSDIYTILKYGGHPIAITIYSIALALLISGFFDTYIISFLFNESY
jgi:hypothetical protein